VTPRLLPLALLLLLAAGPALAQPVTGETGPRVEATVTLVAGQNAYLDVGAADGLTAGDTLTVWRGDARVGRLVVVSAAADRAVVAFAGDVFSITRGARLTLELPALRPVDSTPVPRDTVAAAPVDTTARPSLLGGATPPPAPSATRRTQAPLTGRLQIGVDGLQTTTTLPGGQPEAARSFATPFAALSATADVAAGLRLDLNARAAYRWAEGLTYERPGDLRLYTFSLTRTTSRSDLRAGRFTVEHDPFTGAWDGAALHLGNRARGVGVAAGLQPDYGVGIPTGSFPKAALYAHIESAPPPGGRRTSDAIRWRAQALAGAVFPRGEGLTTRPFVGVVPRIWNRQFSLTAEVLADRDPEAGNWTFSRLGARGSAEVAPGFRLYADAIRRRSYLLFGSTQALLPPSTRLGGGATLTVQGGPLPGATLRADAGTAWVEGFAPTRSVGGGLYAPRIPGLGLGFSADATAWTQRETGGDRTGLTAGVSLSRAVGSGIVQVGYRLGRSPLGLEDVLTTQGLDALVQLPLTPRVALTLQGAYQSGSVLRSTRLYTALWYRF